tara:strand:- start:309 stop:878 length:570 start_codon:yes stop_codon:yes gene_type:complete
MATKREKKEDAKRRIREAVPTLPIPRFFPAPLRLPNLILRGAETLGTGLVELDPLGIITEGGPAMDTSNPASRMMMAMVNDPEFKLSPDLVELINDEDRILVSDGVNMIESQRFSPSIRGQFDRASLISRMSSRTAPKRTRKKTKTDKTMSKALAQANKELRKKNGQYRSGVTQADIMRRAHRLRRKMS